MNSYTAPTCTVKTIRQGPWFLLSVDLKVARELRVKEYTRFSFDRTFAGLSCRGIPLSMKESSTPAAIGPIPILPEKPKGWVPIPGFPSAGLLVRNANPRLAFFGMREAYWAWDCTSLCIHAQDLAVAPEIVKDQCDPQSTDFEVEQFTPDIVNLLAQHDQELKLVLVRRGTFVRVPASLRLNCREWVALGRHVPSGNSTATLAETIIIEERDNCFKLPGRTIDEILKKWGVDATKPMAYDGKSLYFESIRVVQGAKLSPLFAGAALLEGRCLNVPQLEPHGGRVYEVSLELAFDERIVPPDANLQVDPELKAIYLHGNGLAIGAMQRPIVASIETYGTPVILCPKHLVSRFLVPATRAARTYAIPANIRPLPVLTCEDDTLWGEDRPRTWYLRADIQNLPRRDLKREREERQARHKRLVDLYGSKLPPGYTKLTDEQIAAYFQVQDLVQAGELVEPAQHPLMPRYSTHIIVDWIQKQAPHLITQCPVSQKIYLRQMNRFEDLVEIPGFWQAVESVVGEGTWLRRLITCPSVQAAALVSAI